MCLEAIITIAICFLGSFFISLMIFYHQNLRHRHDLEALVRHIKAFEATAYQAAHVKVLEEFTTISLQLEQLIELMAEYKRPA